MLENHKELKLEELLYYFEGLDDSAIKLNDYIYNDGFELVKYTLDEFQEKYERKFRKLIPSQPLFNLSFWWTLDRFRCFNLEEIFKNKYIIFLNDKNKNPIEEKLDDRVNKLIENLKLFKSGHIKLISAFEFRLVEEDDDLGPVIGPIVYSSPSKDIKCTYSLVDEDLSAFKDPFEIPPFLELAFNSFLEYYNIEDEKLKFVMLMIALESIFNKSSQEPIKHIISRHTALTITRNKQKFFEIVERVKFLYNLRSWIVHGDNKKFSKHSTKFPTYILELEELVRNVLKQLIWNEKLFDSKKPTTKEELFDILNASAPLVGPISN